MSAHINFDSCCAALRHMRSVLRRAGKVAAFLGLCVVQSAAPGQIGDLDSPAVPLFVDLDALKAAAIQSSVLYAIGDGSAEIQVVAQGEVHGVFIGQACINPICAGEMTDCIIVLGHADSYGDAIEVLQAFDVVDPLGSTVRVPDAGNLPIAGIDGNTNCVVGGSLPCLVCAGGVVCGGQPPISAAAGVVAFRQHEYVTRIDDPSPLSNQSNVVVRDRCDVAAGYCSHLSNRVQFAAATDVDLCCGNNVTEAGETCDGTDAVGCQRPCRLPGDLDECTCCGDGAVNGGEDCDDGNLVNDDGCNTKCFFACGDGAVNRPGETCDTNDAVGCNESCRPAGTDDECTCCGDGIVQASEDCDDGNSINGDGCSSACLVETLLAGCSPEYWMQSAHLQFWPAAYGPSDRVNTVFGVNATGDPTLLKALSAQGDAECAFLREAVAALVNSADPDVNFYYSTPQVIAVTRAAFHGGHFEYCKTLLGRQNQQGCTLEKSSGGGAVRTRRSTLSDKPGR